MSVDAEYTLDDHENRDSDPYAGAKYDLTLRWLRGRPRGQTLLNVGCGGGVFNDQASAAGFVVHGVEPDADAFALAERRAAGRYRVEQRGLFDLTVADAADVVVMHDVLEHIDAEAATVRQLATVIRPGGLAVVSVPALDSLFGFHDVQLGHFRRYTKTSLRRALRPELDTERVRYFGFTLIPLTLWYSRILKQAYPVQSAQGGVLASAMAALCAIEGRIPTPAGTSVLALARPRPATPLAR